MTATAMRQRREAEVEERWWGWRRRWRREAKLEAEERGEGERRRWRREVKAEVEVEEIPRWRRRREVEE